MKPRIPSTTAESDSDRTDWLAVVVVVGTGIVVSYNVGKVPPAVPMIMADLQVSQIGVGWIASTLSLIGMTLATAIGMWSDRWGQRRVLIAGMWFLAVGSLLGAIADGFVGMIAARAVEGVGYLAYGVSAPSLILRYAGVPRQRLIMGLWSGYMPTGFALALLVGPELQEMIGWRGVWLTAGAASLISGLAMLIATRAKSAAPGSLQGLRAKFIETVTNPGILLLSAAFFAYAFQWVSVMIWLPTFLIQDMAASLGLASALTALIVVVNAPGNFLGGWLMRHEFHPGNIIIVALLIMAVTALGIFLLDLAPVWRLGLCVVFSLGGGILPATCFATAPRYVRNSSLMAGANGLIAQGANAGMLIGPPVFAWAVALAGGNWSSIVIPTCIAAFIGICAGLALRVYKPG